VELSEDGTTQVAGGTWAAIVGGAPVTTFEIVAKLYTPTFWSLYY
jgi:hypothetical protein